MTKREKVVKVLCILGVVLFLAAVAVAVYMMSQNMGQVAGIDFGPGQYYYTDIPGWQKYFMGDHYENHVPMVVLIVSRKQRGWKRQVPCRRTASVLMHCPFVEFLQERYSLCFSFERALFR